MLRTAQPGWSSGEILRAALPRAWQAPPPPGRPMAVVGMALLGRHLELKHHAPRMDHSGMSKGRS
eukprot:6496550-Alexandrium_andersonii.AAC.1